ncbi:MAG: ATPase [Bacteroidales bacterium]|nr:ATPase [Candidatus Liminaster caballi]
MARLIADSGSTKTTWCLTDEGKERPVIVRPVHTQGLNPLYATADDIIAAAREAVRQTGDAYPDLVQFYGSGCSGDRIPMVEEALRRVFTPATRIEVASDLLGACRALYHGSECGIACILGTGAIAARFDAATGQMQAASSLGYILGDEGSGAWFGRAVLSDYLKEQMPQRVRTMFEQDFGAVTAESAISHVYQQQFPNRYLASFAMFIGMHLDVPYCQRLAFDGIETFFRRNVMRLRPSAGESVSFVGSAAFHLQDTIRQVAELHDLTVARIFKDPMEGLIFGK